MDREFQRIAEEISRGGGLDDSALADLPVPPHGFVDDEDEEIEEVEVAIADLDIRDELLEDGGLAYEATCYWPGSDETEDASVVHGETTHMLMEFKGDGQWQFTSSNLTPIELLVLLKNLSETIEDSLEELDEQWEGRLSELGGETPGAVSTSN